MNDKKHIDRLFQEKLRNFEATPSNSVWNNISAELETNKKKRRVIPLWLKISGIAASLLLLITISNHLFNTTTINEDTIVNTIPSNTTKETNKNAEINTNKVSESQNLTNDVQSNSSLNNKKDSKNLLSGTNDASIVSSSQKKNKSKTGLGFKNNNSTPKHNIHAANSSSIASNDVTTENSNSNEKHNKNTLLNKENEKLLKESTTIASEKSIATTLKTLKEDINKIDKSILKNVSDSTKTAVNTEDKLSITEELALVEDDDQTKDQKTKPEDRWSISSNVAPVYFNSLGKGSSIHSQFNSNNKSGDISMSYGIKGSYVLNNKLSVRAGLNKVNIGYSTNDIYVYNNISPASTVEKPIKTIEFTESAQNMIFISGNDLSFSQIPNVVSNQIQGSIDQKLGFLEVPIELEYKLSQKKIGVTVVGGLSTLFLSKNEVYSTLDGNSTYLGKATNVNSTSFSANLGIGIDFKLSEKFNFNLEPTFKYQLNTFSDTSGNFRPYVIGLYSGLSFKF